MRIIVFSSLFEAPAQGKLPDASINPETCSDWFAARQAEDECEATWLLFRIFLNDVNSRYMPHI